MNRPVLAALAAAAVLGAGAAGAADIKQRTAMVCVFDQTRSLTSFDQQADESKPGKVRSWFTQWLFADNQSSQSTKIRFLWEPESPSGPRLKIDSKDTHHVLVRLLSQTPDSLLAASSSSDILTAVGWLFTINFKLEKIMATSVRSNAAGLKSQAVSLSCTFDSETPQLNSDG